MEGSENNITPQEYALDDVQEKKEIVRRYRSLLRSLKPKLKGGDKELVRSSFEMAVEAHKNMRRKTGEPYIFHPLAVAMICVDEIGLGVRSTICALLHDTIEDTDLTLEEVQTEFGSEIARIIDGLTKIATVVDNNKFWSLIKEINKKELSQIYIDLKNLIRFQYIKIINKKYNRDLILIGSNWKEYYPNSIPSNFSHNFINSYYRGNVGLDFGSRDGDEVLYSRSIQILENKALLVQSKQNSLNDKFLNLYKKICFKNPKELINMCENFKKNPKYANDILKKLVYFFNKKNYNFDTLRKII